MQKRNTTKLNLLLLNIVSEGLRVFWRNSDFLWHTTAAAIALYLFRPPFINGRPQDSVSVFGRD